MAIADELEKLRQLHDSGDLSDEEYAKAKDAALRGAGGRPDGQPSEGLAGGIFGGNQQALGDAARLYVSYKIVSGVIGLILFLVIACVVLSNGNTFTRIAP